jgi:CBS domain-containing protein
MQVRHILHGKGRDVVAIAVNATVCDAAKLLTEKRIGALVVKDGSGVLIGIISERDLVRAIAKGGASAFTELVDRHMTPNPETCTEADTVETVMEVMTRGRFRHVPVLDGKQRNTDRAEPVRFDERPAGTLLQSVERNSGLPIPSRTSSSHYRLAKNPCSGWTLPSRLSIRGPYERSAGC